MRILVLTKRQYMGKDLLDDRFGRFRELPLALARLGHDVTGFALSYRDRSEGVFFDSDAGTKAQVTWHAINLGRTMAFGLKNYFRQASKLAREFEPDLVWTCSDAYHAIFGSWLGDRCQIKCVIDLYDNFEGFKATQVPGVLRIFKRAVRKSAGVTCFSERLAERVSQSYEPQGPITVIENGVRTDLFYSRDRNACRRMLGLPDRARIIGTAGALDARRGIETLFRAFEILAAREDDLHLAIAGPRRKHLRIPSGPRIHDLGILTWDRVPLLINALDVAVSCYRDSELGRYSFPQKAYEIIACRVPLVAAAVGTMRDLLSRYPECLFQAENPESLVGALRSHLKDPAPLDIDVPSWNDTAKRLEVFFTRIAFGETASPGQPQSML